MAFTPDQFTNFASSLVAGGAGGIGSPLNAADTVCHVTTGDGAKFPGTAPVNFRMLLGTNEIALVTARSSDTLTLLRGQEGTTAQTWPAGTSVQLGATAANFNRLWQSSAAVYNVMAFGAVGDGVTDDATAINAAISAASGGGGRVVLPPLIFATGSAIVLVGNNVVLQGAGGVSGNTNASRLGATVIRPLAGATFDAITSALPPTPGTAGYISWGQGVRDLSVDCSLMASTVAGHGNGVHFYGVRYGLIESVDVFNCLNYAFLLEGDATNYAYNTTLFNCIVGGGLGAGIMFANSEQCSMIRCVIEGAGTVCAAAQPYSSGSPTTAAYLLDANVGWIDVLDCTFGNLGTYTAEAILLTNGETCKVIGCLFDATRGPALHTTGGSHIISGNTFKDCCKNTSDALIKLGSGGNVVTGNTIQHGSAPGWTYCVQEMGAYTPGNLIANNLLDPGTHGTVLLNSASNAQVRGNIGYNPAGVALNAPATPSPTNAGTGGTVAAGVYQVKVSYVNAIGETTASVAGSTTTSGTTSTITVPSPAASGNATGWYAYVTQPGGGTYTRQQANGSPTAIGTNLTITAPPTSTGLTSASTNGTGVVQPAVPASGTAYVNQLGVDCAVYVAGGTVTAITVGGVTIGLTSGAVRVPANQSITLTYSVAPTWVWIGE